MEIEEEVIQEAEPEDIDATAEASDAGGAQAPPDTPGRAGGGA
jgi:hypothetical protein